MAWCFNVCLYFQKDFSLKTLPAGELIHQKQSRAMLIVDIQVCKYKDKHLHSSRMCFPCLSMFRTINTQYLVTTTFLRVFSHVFFIILDCSYKNLGFNSCLNCISYSITELEQLFMIAITSLYIVYCFACNIDLLNHFWTDFNYKLAFYF